MCWSHTVCCLVSVFSLLYGMYIVIIYVVFLEPHSVSQQNLPSLVFSPIDGADTCDCSSKGHHGSVTSLISGAYNPLDCGNERCDAMSVTFTSKQVVKLMPFVSMPPVNLGLSKGCHVHIPLLQQVSHILHFPPSSFTCCKHSKAIDVFKEQSEDVFRFPLLNFTTGLLVKQRHQIVDILCCCFLLSCLRLLADYHCWVHSLLLLES